MLRYTLRRLVVALPSIFGAVTLVFMLAHVTPGDPVDAMLGETAAPADRQQLRNALGLDRPLFEQYRHYLSGLVVGDLGASLHTGESVFATVVQHYPATLELAAAGVVVAVSLALPLALLSAANPASAIDLGARVFSTLAIALPNFWIAPLLILLFSIALEWTPVAGRGGLSHLFLPAVTIGFGMSASLTRLLRNSLLEHQNDAYIQTARAKGASRQRVYLVHLLRNAALSTVTLLGLQCGALLAGAVVTETVFAWPGIGRLLLNALQTRDYPLIQACVLFFAATYLLINLATDLLHAAIDPRVRTTS